MVVECNQLLAHDTNLTCKAFEYVSTSIFLRLYLMMLGLIPSVLPTGKKTMICVIPVFSAWEMKWNTPK